MQNNTPSDAPLRILNISQNYFIAGGMDVQMFEHERIFRDRGHTVIPFTAADPANRPSKYSDYFPVAARTNATRSSDIVRTLYSFQARKSLARLLDAHPVDIAHLHSYYKRLTPSILPELHRRNIPIVQTLHEYRAVCPVSTMFRGGNICTACRDGRYERAISHRCNGGSALRSTWSATEMWMSDWLGYKRNMAAFVSISNFQRNLLIDMGMNPQKITTVHNPSRKISETSMPGTQSYVLYFGRLETYKGLYVFLELASKFPNTRFVVAGEGSETAAAQEWVQRNHAVNVEFLGVLRAEKLDAIIHNALCTVVPSLWAEAFGLTAIESLTHGVPVLASDIGGLTETVKNEQDGYLTAAGDLPAMARRLDAWIQNPSLARTMGAAGQMRTSQAHSSEVYYAKMMSIYQGVFDQRTAATALQDD